MALLRWIHLRKLVPLTDLIKQMEGGARGTPPPRPAVAPAAPAGPPKPSVPVGGARVAPASGSGPRTDTVKAIEAKRADAAAALAPVDPSILKDAFLSEVRKSKKFFFGTVVAQAQRIEFTGDKVVFTFAPQHRALRAQLEQSRAWLESTASQLAGRRMTVAAAEGTADAPSHDKEISGAAGAPLSPSGGEGGSPAGAAPAGGNDRAKTLKERALSDPGVQTMLDVFAAEIKDVEEKEA
jgi:hypothetical protein